MIPKLFAPLAGLKKPSKDDFYDHCAAEHEKHQSATIETNIGIMEIYDWREYFITVDGNETYPEFDGYCPGQDIISYSIERQGAWDKGQTLLTQRLFNELQGKHGGIVLDFGSHIGYYSLLAALKGYTVASIDGSRENLELLAKSADYNKVQDKISPYLAWLDKDAPVLSAHEESVHLLKVDVEGAEKYVVQMCSELFKAKKIKYAIIEISPVFNISYPYLVENIANCGYKVYQIESDGSIKEIKAEGRPEYVDGLHQENFLFERQDYGN